MMGVDIGPETVELFKEAIRSAGTIIWNGPVGVFEIEAVRPGNERDRPGARRLGGRDHHRRGGQRLRRGKGGVADGSPTSPPAAARRSSTSKGRELPGIAILQDR